MSFACFCTFYLLVLVYHAVLDLNVPQHARPPEPLLQAAAGCCSWTPPAYFRLICSHIAQTSFVCVCFYLKIKCYTLSVMLEVQFNMSSSLLVYNCMFSLFCYLKMRGLYHQITGRCCIRSSISSIKPC